MKGVIDKIWENRTKDGKKYHVLSIGGENYSVWDKRHMEGLQEGAVVDYDWTQSGDFRKVTGIRKLEMPTYLDSEDRIDGRSQQIVRMSCIKSAAALVSGAEADPDEKGEITIGIARKFERYVVEGNGEGKENPNQEE